MSTDPDYNVLRLPKKHGRSDVAPDPEVGRRIYRAQSPRDAVVAGLIVIILFSMSWAALSTAMNVVLPWLSVALGLLVGFAVRIAGKGVDWRFPVIAAVLSMLGVVLGNIVVGAAYTAREFETGTLNILGAVTSMTWPVFFDEVMTAADWVYGLFASGLGAYYANRRLSRGQYAALRSWQKEQERAERD